MATRFKRWGEARRWLNRINRPINEDERPYFEASVIFQADDTDEADKLFEAMTDALGCSERCATESCPHFRVGGFHRMDMDE